MLPRSSQEHVAHRGPSEPGAGSLALGRKHEKAPSRHREACWPMAGGTPGSQGSLGLCRVPASWLSLLPLWLCSQPVVLSSPCDGTAKTQESPYASRQVGHTSPRRGLTVAKAPAHRAAVSVSRGMSNEQRLSWVTGRLWAPPHAERPRGGGAVPWGRGCRPPRIHDPRLGSPNLRTPRRVTEKSPSSALTTAARFHNFNNNTLITF